MRNLTKFLGLTILMAALTFAVACGDDDDDGGSSADNGGASPTESASSPTEAPSGDMASLEGASLSVGSKEFTEQLVLGQIAIKALENAGAEVADNTGITGTDNVRTALTSGEIDMYWEYTGTGWSSHLGREISDAPAGSDALYQAVKEADEMENHIYWLDPAPMNDTYALVTSASNSSDMGVTTISQYAELANSDPEAASLCGATEWLTRDDGLPGLETAYGFDIPDDQVAEVEFSLINKLTGEGNECHFGEAFATDGSIVANDLVVLEDDQEYFVPYNVAMTVRQETYDEYGDAIAEVLNPIAAMLTDEVMQTLNAKVDVDGEDPATVAEDWLKENGFIS
jgi:osmoprotectant transport system substrate-binding protein